MKKYIFITIWIFMLFLSFLFWANINRIKDFFSTSQEVTKQGIVQEVTKEKSKENTQKALSNDVVNNESDSQKKESTDSIKTEVDPISNNIELKQDLSDTLSWKLVENTWMFCILNECIPKDIKVKYLKENDMYFAKYSSWEEMDKIEYSYELSKSSDSFKVNFSEMMHDQVKVIKKIENVYIKSVNDSWCGGSNLEQTIFDVKWKEISNYQLSDIPKEIYIWNVKFIQSLSGSGWFWQPLDSYNKFKVYKDTEWNYNIYNNINDFTTFITNKVINEDKKLYKNYIAQFKKYPGVNVMYNSVWYDESAIRVVYLGTDKKYIEKNIKQNGNFLDLSISNKIISYYTWSNTNYNIFDKNGNKITQVTQKDLPFFTVKPLNNSGNYLVYLQNWNTIESTAEMCKPVVYYYSKDNSPNSLTLDLKEKDYLTKLIPELDKNNTWNFNSQSGKIIVENKKYDYLYYSLVTVWYEHNKNWWIIKWNDIVDFFEDKLTKINFNSQEKKDFIDFWKTEYEKEKYYFVSFKYKSDLDKIIPLKFSKKVDSEFRVLLDSYEIKNYSNDLYENFLYKTSVKDQFDEKLIQRFERGNAINEVFEWGWVLKKINETIIK